MPYSLPWSQWANSLWPSDSIWQRRSGSTLAQVRAWCLTAPSHYQKKKTMLTGELWNLVVFTGGQIQEEMLKIYILNMMFKITSLKLLPYIPGLNELSRQVASFISKGEIYLPAINRMESHDNMVTWFNSMWPRGTIWCLKTWLTLAQVMVCGDKPFT